MTITITQNVPSMTVPSVTLAIITYCYQDNIRKLRGFFIYAFLLLINTKRNFYMTTVDVILTFTGTTAKLQLLLFAIFLVLSVTA